MPCKLADYIGPKYIIGTILAGKGAFPKKILLVHGISAIKIVAIRLHFLNFRISRLA